MVAWISIIILAVVFPWVQQLGSWFLFLGLIISGLLLAEGLIGHWSLRDERQRMDAGIEPHSWTSLPLVYL